MKKLLKHIEDSHENNQAAFARWYSEELGRNVFPQQISRWLKADADWDEESRRIKLEPRTRAVV